MSTSPTARTRTFLKGLGVPSGTVEKWIPQTRRRQDLFGWIDVVATVPADATIYTNGCDPLPAGIYGLQVTAGSRTDGRGGGDAARRVKKLMDLKPEDRSGLLAWLAAGHLEVWSWAKRGAAGKPKLWTLKRRVVTLADFDPDIAHF